MMKRRGHALGARMERARIVRILGMTMTMAAAVALAAPSSAEPILHEVLPNGLEALLLAEPGRELVSIQIWYRAGAPDEEAETVGFAHLLEHLMFTGTATVPDFRAAIASLGGQASSSTYEDLTYFSSEVPAAAAEAVIALEADRMRSLVLDRAAITRALEDVRLELAAAASRPAPEVIIEELREVAFAGHPLARTPLRSAPTPATATPERCRAFYDRCYGPDRACVVAVGGFEPGALVEAIRTHFGPLTAGGMPPAPLGPPPVPTERRRVIDQPGPTWIAAGFRVPGEESPDAPALRLLLSYLNAEAADSLRAALEENGGAAARATTARLELLPGASLLAVMAVLDEGADAERALDRLTRAVTRLARAPGATQLATARDRVRLSEAQASGSVKARGQMLAVAQLRLGGYAAYGKLDAALAAVQPADLVRIAGAHLRPEDAATLRAGPPATPSRPAGSEGSR